MGYVMAMVAGKKPPASPPYLHKDGRELSRTHNWMLHRALARSLCESKVHFVVEGSWPFRERPSGQNGRSNPLRTSITTEAGALFDNHSRLKNKALLLDITIVNPCPSSNLENITHHTGNHLADAIKRKKNICRGSFPRYLLPPSSHYVDVW